MSIKVLIADDHAVFRSILRDVLTSIEGIDVVAECSDGNQVTDAAAQTSPDVVLMDLQMPSMSGLEATWELLSSHPDMRVIVLTACSTPASVADAKAAGAVGYLFKGSDFDELVDQVRTVAAGGTAWSPVSAQP